MYDWNDLRFLIAVADSGSTLAAARRLRVSQTTVARRIAALEDALALNLFERRQAGYVLTPVGAALLEDAKAVAAAAGRFGDVSAAAGRAVQGKVKLTTLEIYAVTFLIPILRDLRHAHPGIHVELDTSEERRDLAASAADVAVRSSKDPKEGGLVGRRIAPDPWTVYCSRDYAAEHGVPRNRKALARHPFIGGGGGGVWPEYRNWLRRYGLEDTVVIEHDNVPGLLAAVHSGVGLSVLPTFVADREPDLVQCVAPITDDAPSIWLLTHERMRHVPRVRAVMDFLGERLSALAKESG